ncbi:MAG: SDR family NAD(P)-dependent oxidoreductase [Bacteroidales bacterium]|nr:SDR family NAD(P)-dependent oxidoreductase [Bacteroidales bacterium]
MSVYVASKWAAYGWSESMRLELEEIKSNVHVTTAAPYFINTGMFGGIRPKVFRIQDPEKTARKIIRAIEIDKQTRGIPFPVHFIRFNQAIFPSAAFDWLFGKVFGLYEVMDHFVGRKKAN